MKKFLFIVGVVILSGSIFVGGLFAGSALDFMNGLLQVSAFDQALVDASITSMRISQLDEGRIEEAKHSLNIQLDSQIMTLGIFLKDCPNAESMQHAEKTLTRIAEHRIKYPVSKDEDMEDVEDYVQEILTHALENKTTTEPVN